MCLLTLQEYLSAIYFRETNRDFFILKKWSDDHGHNNRRVMRHFVQLRRIVSNGDIARNDRWIRRITEQHYCSRRILSHATMRGSGMKGCYNHSLF